MGKLPSAGVVIAIRAGIWSTRLVTPSLVASVKSVVAICLLIVLVGQGLRDWPAAHVSPAVVQADPGPWVRTAHGWERLDTWQAPHVGTFSPGLHPLVVAVGMACASLLGLAATNRD